MEAPSKAFLLFSLLPDWLKLNHLKSRMEYGFSDIFSRHICSTAAETIGMTNYPVCFGAKNVLWGGGVSESMDGQGCAILALEVVPKNLIFA